MREGWNQKTLDEACEIHYGERVTKKRDSGTVFPVYGGGGETFRIDRFNREDCTIVSRFGMSESCVRHVSGKFFLNDSGLSLRPRNPIKLYARFLDYFLYGSQKQIYSLGRGSAQRNLDVKAFRQLAIGYPDSLTQQKRIVAIIDEAFAGIDTAIANTKKSLANARELFESYLNSVFSQRDEGWVTKPLGECFRLRSGDGLTSKQMRPGEFPVFGGNGIVGRHDQFNLSGSSVIIGRVGALCGNARHVNESIWLTDNAFKVVDKQYSLDDQFLAYLLNAYELRQYARQAAQPVISNSSLKGINLSFPESHSEQLRIVEQLDDLRKETLRIEALYQQKLTVLSELKQSLLQRAFSGELTGETAVAEGPKEAAPA